ncbi:saccharopine dehydrogenase C-terminal domain-containing protein [Thermovirga sp.]|uniref:saccharopine dehydrogenase family protein n=1 Tax=Thermovirga sp. TaxID=2699834 RepID=UPI0025E448D6|nr:saccharopine dehydrogenase C-terminal domain-containing protein [Thermovirga sp.]MBO8154476.1 saccharopine dehydrogenase NADP-binding domain-containing protein [Thermovirga sp.]
MKAVQLGAGLVGQLIAADLAKDFDVTVVDLNEKTLQEIREKYPSIKTAVASATDEKALAPILEDADIVTAGVPGRFGFEMMKTVIGLGKNLVDISFMPEDFEELNDFAKEKGVTVIPDIGVAPGMSNFLMGRGAALLDEVEDAHIFVGGIPTKEVPPFNYQVTWSPKDCIEEFTRPVTIVKDGKKMVVEATSGLHQREFPGVGTLEAFYTDGLRSLAKNIKAKNLGEMTLRWPGHVEQMRLLRTMGMFDETPKVLGGKEVIPLEVTADLLFPLWKMEPEKGDRDLTVMLVEVHGYKGCDEVTYSWYLLDYFDEETWNTSMSRCTGSTCAIFARAVAGGLIKEKGVLPAEKLAHDDNLYKFVLEEQRKRRIKYTESVKIVKDVH